MNHLIFFSFLIGLLLSSCGSSNIVGRYVTAKAFLEFDSLNCFTYQSNLGPSVWYSSGKYDRFGDTIILNSYDTMKRIEHNVELLNLRSKTSILFDVKFSDYQQYSLMLKSDKDTLCVSCPNKLTIPLSSYRNVIVFLKLDQNEFWYSTDTINIVQGHENRLIIDGFKAEQRRYFRDIKLVLSRNKLIGQGVIFYKSDRIPRSVSKQLRHL